MKIECRIVFGSLGHLEGYAKASHGSENASRKTWMVEILSRFDALHLEDGEGSGKGVMEDTQWVCPRSYASHIPHAL